MTRTRSIWIKSLLVGVISLVGTLVFASVAAGVSVAIGMGLALANFWLLERLVKELLKVKAPCRRRLLLMIAFKVLVLFGVLAFVVLKVPIEAGPFLLGLSCVVGGIVLEGITGLFSSEEEVMER